MAQVDSKAHPYMPNSAGDTREVMLSAIGIRDVEELFEQISMFSGIYIFISIFSLFLIRKRINPVII